MNKFLSLSYLYILILSIIKYIINEETEIIPKKLIHGLPQNDTWKSGECYEYYIDISNYDLNEENIFEIYELNSYINIHYIKLYMLLTDVNDEKLIINNTIKPNKEKDQYIISSLNIKYDSLYDEKYFFFPFQKTNNSQNFLIILIQNIYEEELQTFFYVSKRIHLMKIKQTNPNKTKVIINEIEARNDMRLYYKVDISKIDLIKNNVYFFIPRGNNYSIDLEVNYLSENSDLQLNYHNLYILEKNKTNISEIFFGIKTMNNSNHQKYVNLSIRIDDNDYYYINEFKRIEAKLYIENIKCHKDVFIFEDYYSYNSEYLFLVTLEKLYGNYKLRKYDLIDDLNFEDYPKEDERDISVTKYLEDSLLTVYILQCITPSAFNFEIFYAGNFPDEMEIGGKIKTYLWPYEYYYDYIFLSYLNTFDKYKIQTKIIDNNKIINRTLFIHLHTQGQFINDKIIEPKKEISELIYADYDDTGATYFGFNSRDSIIIEYFLTSNSIYTNIAEGRTIIDRLLPHSGIKIRKDIQFDYISFKAQCDENIKGKYELQIINIKDIEPETNILMVGLPNIKMPFAKYIYLRFSNPYNKFDQMTDIYSDDNYYYLLLSFEIGSEPIYIDVDYYFNEQLINLTWYDSEIISPKKEYKVIALYNYFFKDKKIFNVHRCTDTVNYTIVNYFENKNNIIKKTEIVNPHQIFLIDNIYVFSKLTLYKDSETNDTKDDDSKIVPAPYYRKGDILLNYFDINYSIYKQIKFTSNYSITYKEESWNKIIFSWNEYIHRELNNNEKIKIPTNYSIYILPKNSIVNTMCQLHLIPANKSIADATQIKIDLNEGEYKVMIIAKVINVDMPFDMMYDVLELNVIKKINIVLIVLCSFLGFIAIIIIILLIIRRRILVYIKKRKLLKNINDMDINKMNENFEEELEEEESEDEDNKKEKRGLELIKIISHQ